MSLRSLVAAYTLSGSVALALEILWFRSLELSLGSSFPAVMALLSGYMLGLSTGSLSYAALSHRRSINASLLLGMLHLMFLLSGVALLASGGRFTLPAGTPPLLQWVFGITLILPTGAVAGASFPAAAAALKDRESWEGWIMVLYGMNIIGGIAGIASVSFLGLEHLGSRRCALITTGASALLALWFFLSGKSADSRSTLKPLAIPTTSAAHREDRLWISGAFALGFLGLGMETAVVRILTPIMGLSLYALSATVVPYLVGLGVGAILVRRLVRGAATRVFIRCAVATALLWCLTLILLPFLPSAVLWAAKQVSGGTVTWAALMVCQVVGAMVVIAPAATGTGTLFPLTLHLGRSSGSADAVTTGRFNAANALGAALGPLTTGLVLVSFFGVHGSFRLLAGGYLLLAIVVAGKKRFVPAFARVAAPAAVFLLIFLPNPDPLDHHAGIYWAARRYAPLIDGPYSSLRQVGGSEREVLEVIEGPTASVLVVRRGEQLYLTIDGKPASNTLLDSTTQLALARIPLALKPSAKKVLVIGWGSGQTAAEVLRYPVEKVVSVEISPEVVEAAPWFASVNGRALTDSRLSVLIDDGRHYLATSKERFDVIISQPSNPWVGASSSLFTREFFELCRRRLTDNGMLVQWFQTYGAGEEEVNIFDATFTAVFPDRGLWKPQAGDLILVAPIDPDYPRQMTETDLAMIPAKLPDNSKPLNSQPLNTDDRPLLSFRLARHLLENDIAVLFLPEASKTEEANPSP